MELNKKEQAWFARLHKCLSAAPDSIKYKIRAALIDGSEFFVDADNPEDGDNNWTKLNADGSRQET